jgi:hypothetical protein
MKSLPPLASEINRMIRYLAGAEAGLSVLSLSTYSLPASVIHGLLQSATLRNDILGRLVDGSIGALTIRPHGVHGSSELEQAFLDRLQPAMSALSERRFGGRVTLWLRSVHKPAAEIGHAADLINGLFDAVSTPITINAAASLPAITPALLFPRVPTLQDPFIEPIEREAPLLRMIRAATVPPYFE